MSSILLDKYLTQPIQKFSVGGSVRQRSSAAIPVRKVVNLPRDKDGLFIQPTTTGPDYEFEESHRRHGFAEGYKYADETTGNTRTFDPKGDYNCGTCNKADKDKCLFVEQGDIPLKPLTIDRQAGSCGYWENLCAGDPELSNNQKSRDSAVYGVAKNGKGFGCHRCPFASRALAPDSRGRDLFCGKGAFRVPGNACCGSVNKALQDWKKSRRCMVAKTCCGILRTLVLRVSSVVCLDWLRSRLGRMQWNGRARK